MSTPGDIDAFRTNGGLDLPPVWRAVALRESGDAFAHAVEVAAEEGAGTLVWVRRFDTVEFAIVLEPEEPLVNARRTIYAAMNAAADALAIHSPPEKPIEFSWPDTLLFDGAIIGGSRLAWPRAAAENDAPDWLVVGMIIRSVLPMSPRDGTTGGHILDQAGVIGTSLDSEGFALLDGAQLIESFARHFMVQVDLWLEKGFVPVGQQFLGRMPMERSVKRGLDGNGDLLLRTLKSPSEPDRKSLLEALAHPQWLDPETQMPWL